MFLHLSVSHSVHRGVSAQCMLGYTPLDRHPQGRHPPGQTLPGRHALDRSPWADTPSRHSLGRHPLRDTPPWADTHNPRQTPLADTPLGRHPTGQADPWTDPPGRHPWADTHPPGQTPPWADTPGQMHTPRQTPPSSGHCSGRYASYWNAFLLVDHSDKRLN